MYKEKIVIWSGEDKSYFDDQNEIKRQLKEKLDCNIEIFAAKLLQNLGEIKVYLVAYNLCKINDIVKVFKGK